MVTLTLSRDNKTCCRHRRDGGDLSIQPARRRLRLSHPSAYCTLRRVHQIFKVKTRIPMTVPYIFTYRSEAAPFAVGSILSMQWYGRKKDGNISDSSSAKRWRKLLEASGSFSSCAALHGNKPFTSQNHHQRSVGLTI